MSGKLTAEGVSMTFGSEERATVAVEHIDLSFQGFAPTSIWLDRTEFARSGDALRRRVYLTLPPLSAASSAPKPK